MFDTSQFSDAASKSSLLTNQTFYGVNSIEGIRKLYQIDFIAPVDLRCSNFKDRFFDTYITTNTLKHIPYDSIVMRFNEFMRVAKNEGIIPAVIDYSDQYLHTDKSISKTNFSTKKFKKYQHNIHLQNRLRHYGFKNIFEMLGFEIIKVKALNIIYTTKKILEEFKIYSKNLCANHDIFLLSIKKYQSNYAIK